MNPVELFHADGKSAGVFYCGTCRIVARDREGAEVCCKPWQCKTCGKEVPRFHGECHECIHERYRKQSEEKLEKAEKLETWDGPVFHPDIGHNNGYFASMEEALDYFAEELEEQGDIKFMFVCNRFPFQIDLSDAIESATVDMYDDFDPGDLDGIPELESAVKVFNDRNSRHERWEPDYSRAIAVPPWKGEEANP